MPSASRHLASMCTFLLYEFLDRRKIKEVDKNLGQGYSWSPGPNISGGTLYYKSQAVALVRDESKRNSVGSWI